MYLVIYVGDGVLFKYVGGIEIRTIIRDSNNSELS